MINKKFEVKLNGIKIKLYEGLYLIDPSHGVGCVKAVETQELFGEEVVLCNMHFAHDNIKLLIPINKMKDMGIRTLSSKDMAQKIINNVLSKGSKGARGVWTKRIVEYETKYYSGSSILIAEVVRDLFQSTYDSSRSYGERTLFEKSIFRLVNEFRIVFNVPYEEAYRKVYDALLTTMPVIKEPMMDDISGEGDFDDDIDNSDEDDDDDLKNVA